MTVIPAGILTLTMSLLAHYYTCTRSKSCFGGLIEQSGYLVSKFYSFVIFLTKFNSKNYSFVFFFKIQFKNLFICNFF